MSILATTDPQALPRALELLNQGQAIAFPTDTVYGVGARANDPTAILRLYAVKRRPLSQAIPLLIADASDLDAVAALVTPLARRLTHLWPGALTLVVPAAPHLPGELLAGGSTVAVRLPDHPWLRDLIRASGAPLAATSANLHGHTDPQHASDVATQLGTELPLIIDGGATPGPIPSTIIDCTGEQPRVLRQGALPWERIAAALGE